MNEIQARITDFERLCRLCLHEDQVLMDIFDSTKDCRNLAIYQKIKACATIDLCKNDGLPTRICAPCLSSLNAAFEFKVQCENADKTLHEIYHLLVTDQIMCKKKKEKRIVLMNNNVESLLGENQELTTKQFKGFNQVFIIKRQNNGTLEEENNPCDDNDCDCEEKDDKEKKAEMEDSLYVVNDFKKNIEQCENIIVDEVMSVNEEGAPSGDSFDDLSIHTEEITKSNEVPFLAEGKFSIPRESLSPTLDVLEKKEEINMSFFEVEPKRNKATQEAKRSACPFCYKVLTRVNEHIRLLHRNKVYICKKNDCGAEFLTLKNLQSHQLKCFNMEKPYKCLKCFKEFYRKCNYKAHIVRHSNKKAFQCQLCDKAFVDSTGLRRHFLKHHEPQQETFTSGCCGKKFKTKEGLKQHIQRGVCGVQIFPVFNNSINNIK